MIALLQSEWHKLRKTKIMPIIFLAPLIGLLVGLAANDVSTNGQINSWYWLLAFMNLTYALLFLPLITGVLGGVICRYEHQAGGWKQLLALPVTRGGVFGSKFTLLMILVLVIQLLYFCAVYVVGMMKGFSDPFPIEIVWKSIFGGWAATFPLVALQLWMAILFKSFAASFAVNVIFTLPAILAVNSERFGPYYPWAQPFLMMNIGGNINDLFLSHGINW